MLDLSLDTLLRFAGASVAMVLTYQVFVIGLRKFVEDISTSKPLLLKIFTTYYYVGFYLLPIFCGSVLACLLCGFLPDTTTILFGHNLVDSMYIASVFLLFFGWFFVFIMFLDLMIAATRSARI